MSPNRAIASGESNFSSPLAAAWNAALIFFKRTLPICAVHVHDGAGWAAALQCWEPNSEREREGQHGVFRLTAVVWPHDRMRQPPGLRRPVSRSLRLDRRLSGIGSQAVSVRGGRLSWRHLEMRRSAPANAPVRGHCLIERAISSTPGNRRASLPTS